MKYLGLHKLLWLLYGLVRLAMCYIDIFLKKEKPKNKVHFYIARDKDGELWLYMGKPFRGDYEFYPASMAGVFKDFGLNPDDFKNLKWEDEPVEVFLNLED